MKQAILLAAYGAGGVQGTHTLQLFERMVREAFPASSIRWAFTSMVMRNRLAGAGKKTDSIIKALCRLGFEKYDRVTVQSLHMIPGQEYETLLGEIKEAAALGAPRDIATGVPLLYSDNDIESAARAIIAHLPAEREPDEAVIWVGHGTEHEGGRAYDRLTRAVQRLDENIFVGTLAGGSDASDGAQAYLPILHERGIKQAWLMPLLSVVGKHASEDIAGEAAESWRGVLASGGVSSRTVLRGAIEYQGFADIWLSHLKEAVGSGA